MSKIILSSLEARNETSHTYDGNVAKKVYAVAIKYYSDAAALLEKLREINL